MKRKYVWEDQQEIDAFLNEQEVGTLSTVDEDGGPYAIPLNYVWHGGSIYFHGGLGRKINNLRRNPKACFTVTEALGILTVEITSSPCQDTQLGRSVVLGGQLLEIIKPEQKRLILKKLLNKYDKAATEKLENGQMAPEGLSNQAAFQACLVLELQVSDMTARQQLLEGKPEKYRKAVAAYFQQKGQEKGSQRDCKTALLINQALEKEAGLK